MKDLLLVLFYQAIGTVNAAAIISGIIWLAKRKDENDGRKPNPDFTQPPKKEPEVELRSALIRTVNGEKFAYRWYDPDEQIPQYAILQGEPYKFFAEMDKDGGKLVEFVRIKPPTTGTNAIEPKRRWDSWDEDDAEFEKVIRYAVEHECSYQAAKLALASGYNPAQKEKPPTTGSAAIKPKCGISADEAAKLYSKLAEASARLGGNSELDEPRERVKDVADRLDRTDKKPVTPERMKEAGFGVEPVNVFNPAEESAERSETDFINAKCADCKYYANSLSGGYCVLRKEPANPNERRRCYFFKKYEAPAKNTNICQNCKHYLATDEDATTGICGMNDEITFGNNYSDCFEKREEKDHE